MLPVIIGYIASHAVAKLMSAWRPLPSTAILAFPLMIIASLIAYALLALAIWDSEWGPMPLTAGFDKLSLVGAITTPFWMWRDIRNSNNRMAAKKAAIADRVAYEAELHKLTPEGLLEENASARAAINHRHDIKEIWLKLQELGQDWAAAFIKRLEDDPRADPFAIVEEISNECGEIYPHADAITSYAYSKLHVASPKTRAEFRSSLFLLGKTIDPIDLAENLLARDMAD